MRSPHRGRSTRAEYEWGLKRAQAFADVQGIDCGVQVSPIDVHLPLLDELSADGWNIQQAVVVMTGQTQTVAAGADAGFELTVTDSATPEWVEAWAHCDGRADVEEHVQTVFPRMAGQARFARAGQARGRDHRRAERHRRPLLHRRLARAPPPGARPQARAGRAQ